MNLKPLGATEVMVPEVGLGTWNYQGDPQVIHMSLEMGGDLIDSAENYHAEVHVGNAVRGRRDVYFIATKVAGEHLRHRDVLRVVDASLKGLETDHIDSTRSTGPSRAYPWTRPCGPWESW